jgi:UDP-glucose 4-epimerase
MTYKNVLVTGGTGFIGHALIAQLVAGGCAVTALVRRKAELGPSIRQIQGDLRHSDRFLSALAGERFEVVFHLAAAGVAPDNRETDSLFATNIAGTGALVEAAARCGAGAVVYCGSCAEYDVDGGHDLLRENAPFTRQSLYGASKAAGGVWGTALAERSRISFCWLRLFGVYGPREPVHRLIPYVASRLYRNQPVDLTPGAQMRDLMYVDEAAEALAMAGHAALDGQSGPFNVCTGRAAAIGDVARDIASLLGKPTDLLRFGARPYRDDEPLWLVGDPGSFSRQTGFAARISVSDGVRATLRGLGYLP